MWGGEEDLGALRHHLMVQLDDGSVIAPSILERRCVARAVLKVGRDLQLLAFRAAGMRLHMAGSAGTRGREEERAYVPGSKRSEAELMQWRWPVGGGPSSKMWPRCAPQPLQTSSLRTMPSEVSLSVLTAASPTGCQ